MAGGRGGGPRGADGVREETAGEAAAAGVPVGRVQGPPSGRDPQGLPGVGGGEGDGPEQGLGAELGAWELGLSPEVGQGVFGVGSEILWLGPGIRLNVHGGDGVGPVLLPNLLCLRVAGLSPPLRLRALLGANHARDAVGPHARRPRAVEHHAGEHPLVQGLLKPEPGDPPQGLRHGAAAAAGEARALTFVLLRAQSPVGGAGMVPGRPVVVLVLLLLLLGCGVLGVCAGSPAALLLRLAVLAGALRAVVFGVDGDLRQALLDLGLALGGGAGSAAQEVGAKRVLATKLSSSMAVQGRLLWVSVKKPFYAAGRPGL